MSPAEQVTWCRDTITDFVLIFSDWFCGYDCFFRVLINFYKKNPLYFSSNKIYSDISRIASHTDPLAPLPCERWKSWQPDTYFRLPSEFPGEYQTCRVWWHHRFCSHSLARANSYSEYSSFTLPVMNNQMSTETLQTKMGKTLEAFFFFLCRLEILNLSYVLL